MSYGEFLKNVALSSLGTKGPVSIVPASANVGQTLTATLATGW